MRTSYISLTNQRCQIKDLAETILYRNNWCENDGDCSNCGICKSYEEGFIKLKKPLDALVNEQDPSMVNPENLYNA